MIPNRGEAKGGSLLNNRQCEDLKVGGGDRRRLSKQTTGKSGKVQPKEKNIKHEVQKHKREEKG